MVVRVRLTVAGRYYLAVCFPLLFERQGAREYVIERAISLRIRCGHAISVSNPAVLLKLLLEARDSRQKYAARVRISIPALQKRNTLRRYASSLNAGQFLHRINVAMGERRKSVGHGRCEHTQSQEIVTPDFSIATRYHTGFTHSVVFCRATVENDETGRNMEDE